MSEKSFYYSADDISSMLNVSPSYSYRIIVDLNNELKELGFITISGRVPKAYFHKRFYLEKNNIEMEK